MRQSKKYLFRRVFLFYTESRSPKDSLWENSSKKRKKMKNSIKFLIGFMFCILYRLIPVGFRPPNVTPLISVQLPYGKLGRWQAFLFGLLNIVVYDLVTSFIFRLWEFSFSSMIIRGSTLGFVGLMSTHLLPKNRASFMASLAVYFGVTLIGIVFYDLITGVLVPCLGGASWLEQFVLQIEFTCKYSYRSIIFVPLSVFIDRWIVGQKVLETKYLFQKLRII